jgi:hypothetical protein
MPRRRFRRWRWAIGILVLLLIVVAFCVRTVIVRAQPILRTRVIETLSTRVKSRVDLAELHVWIANGVHVCGKGLKIFGATDPNPWEPGVQPLLEIEAASRLGRNLAAFTAHGSGATNGSSSHCCSGR